jgi:hypothetical protein
MVVLILTLVLWWFAGGELALCVFLPALAVESMWWFKHRHAIRTALRSGHAGDGPKPPSPSSPLRTGSRVQWRFKVRKEGI